MKRAWTARQAARPDPESVAKTVRAAWSVTRDRLAAERRDWSSEFLPQPWTVTDLDIERIVAVLADHAERLLAVERLADYAAERAESHDGG